MSSFVISSRRRGNNQIREWDRRLADCLKHRDMRQITAQNVVPLERASSWNPVGWEICFTNRDMRQITVFSASLGLQLDIVSEAK